MLNIYCQGFFICWGEADLTGPPHRSCCGGGLQRAERSICSH